jgi:hypothetical protein
VQVEIIPYIFFVNFNEEFVAFEVAEPGNPAGA